MAYKKQTWVDLETPLDAEHMNHIEDGIGSLSEEIAELKTVTENVVETKSGDFVSVETSENAPLRVVTRITGQDAEWAMANRIKLRHVKSKNLYDFAGYLGGAGEVFENSGVTATINADATISVKGTNTSGSAIDIVKKTFSATSGIAPIFPAGTYTTGRKVILGTKKCDKSMSSLGNKTNTFTVDEPFFISQIVISVSAGATVDDIYPLYISRGSEDLTGDYGFSGETYEAVFANKFTDGAFDWQTGELKDANGALVETIETAGALPAYDGTNYIFAGIGSNDVSYDVTVNTGVSGGFAFDYRNCGVPVLKLSGDVSAMTKENAVPLTYVWGERHGSVSVKKQGSSSIQTGIEIGAPFDTELGGLFNFTLKFDNAFEAKEGWGVQSKYCFKANAIDHSHSRNVCSCKLWGEIVKSRANVPTELSSLVNGGAIDGFPIIITLNGNYYATGTFNIPKDGWMFGSPKAILCADKDTNGATEFKGLAALDGNDFDLEYVEDENNADWVLTSINKAIQAVMDSDGSNLDTTVGQYIDIPSAIDYYIHAVYERATDGTKKNYILVTFDGVKWYFSDYDRDTVYGIQWRGDKFGTPVLEVNYQTFASGHAMMNLIYTYKRAELKERSVELRGGVLSEANVATVFTNFAAGIPSELLAQNCRRWPLLRSTNVSNISQILNWYRLRRVYIDNLTDKL